MHLSDGRARSLVVEMGKNLKSMVLVRFGFLYGQGSVRFWFLLSCCLKSSGSVRVLPINGSVRVRVRFLVLLAGSIRIQT
jgi:hypothetical protein